MLTDLSLPAALETRADDVVLRRASEADLDELVALLADDPISVSRGDRGAAADRAAYLAGLRAVLRSAGNDIVVAVDGTGKLVGTLQLARIPGMVGRGATRLLVDAVRVRHDARSRGIGSALLLWVADVAASELGADVVQLDSDAARTEAHRFYERLGFTRTNVGFRRDID